MLCGRVLSPMAISFALESSWEKKTWQITLSLLELIKTDHKFEGIVYSLVLFYSSVSLPFMSFSIFSFLSHLCSRQEDAVFVLFVTQIINEYLTP